MNDQMDHGVTANFDDAFSRKVLVGRQSAQKKPASIEVDKEGDQISRIVIRCSCGEEIIVKCDYSNTA